MKALIALLVVLFVVLVFVLKPDATKPVVQATPIEEAAALGAFQPEAVESRIPASHLSVAEVAPAATAPSEESAAHTAQRSVAPGAVILPQVTAVPKAADRRTAAAEQGGSAPQVAQMRPSFSVPQNNAFPQTPLIGNPAVGSSQEILVPQGGRLPAALIDLDQTSPEQAQAADGIAESFLNVVSNEAPEARQPRNRPTKDAAAARERAWEAARADADERYRQLFGDEAYKAYSNAAAIEALREKQLQANPK